MGQSMESVGLPSEVAPEELSQLFAEFSQATAQLQAAHDSLLDEVQTLRDELELKNQRLERKKRLEALGRVAAGVAHEFRNPLGGIRLTVDALLSSSSDEKTTGRLEHVRRATTHLDCIVEDLLTFTRSDPLEKNPVSVSDLIDGVLEIANPEAGVVRREGPSDMEVVVDRHTFTRVLVNLVVNARQILSEPEDQVGVAWGMTPDARPWFEVADNGPGIPLGEEEQVFHPFHSQREGGTGLGLAIVHDRVEAHDGEVSVVRDEPWGPWSEWTGARFRIVLPSPNEVSRSRR